MKHNFNHYISRFFYPKCSVWTQTEVKPVDSDYVTCCTTCSEVLQNRRLKYEGAHVAKCCATDMNKRRIHEASYIIKLGTACKCVGRGNPHLTFLWRLNKKCEDRLNVLHVWGMYTNFCFGFFKATWEILIYLYRGTDKSLVRPASRCILFRICVLVRMLCLVLVLLYNIYIYIYIYIVLIFLQLCL
jgi:hypothetical protein